MSNEIIDWILKNRWKTAGKYLVLRAFGIYDERFNEGVKLRLQNVINKTLTNWFSSDNLNEHTKKVIKEFNFPDDFEAFAGWLEYLKEKNVSLDLQSWAIDEFGKRWIVVGGHILNGIHKRKSNSNSIENYWPKNIFEPKSQIAITHALWFIISSNGEIWTKWQRMLKKMLCQAIRPLYYGSHTARNVAKNLSEHMLIFILSFVNMPDDEFNENENSSEKVKKIKLMLELISNNILFPYVRITEILEPQIWDEESSGQRQYVNKEFYLINKYLENITKEPINIDFHGKKLTLNLSSGRTCNN